MKRLGRKRRHPSKEITIKNKSSSTTIKKPNQKENIASLQESNTQNANQVNTQDKLIELKFCSFNKLFFFLLISFFL